MTSLSKSIVVLPSPVVSVSLLRAFVGRVAMVLKYCLLQHVHAQLSSRTELVIASPWTDEINKLLTLAMPMSRAC